MSKIKCLCGHIIVDQTDYLPYKAQFFADEDDELAWERFIVICADFVRAREAGKQNEFIEEKFGEGYPKDLTLEDIINDSLAGMRAVFGHNLYECEHCGRIWIEPASLKGKNRKRLVSYLPENAERGVLSSKKEK